MRIKSVFENGYNSITEANGKHSEMLMDFGMLKLTKGEEFTDNNPLEKVYLLVQGEVKFCYDNKTVIAKRNHFSDDDFFVLNLSSSFDVTVCGISDDSEVCVIRTENEKDFGTFIFDKTTSVIEKRGEGYMNECGTRIVKTFMDVRLSSHSNIMLGEDMHFPGKWAGFPSHHHPQPEIYFYKLCPENGFGLLKLGDEGVLLEHNDTVLIRPSLVHPQVAAPGYAMYFIWAIRHLPNNPYVKPIFEEEHLWVEKPGAKYWPDKI